jgi:hypothetical protein
LLLNIAKHHHYRPIQTMPVTSSSGSTITSWRGSGTISSNNN